jgi:hypothetical protein
LSKLSRRLTKAQKISRDIDAITSGKPDRIARRVKNRLLGRALRRVGLFKWLFK